jgi:hypothetical protein
LTGRLPSPWAMISANRCSMGDSVGSVGRMIRAGGGVVTGGGVVVGGGVVIGGGWLR